MSTESSQSVAEESRGFSLGGLTVACGQETTCIRFTLGIGGFLFFFGDSISVSKPTTKVMSLVTVSSGLVLL